MKLKNSEWENKNRSFGHTLLWNIYDRNIFSPISRQAGSILTLNVMWTCVLWSDFESAFKNTLHRALIINMLVIKQEIGSQNLWLITDLIYTVKHFSIKSAMPLWGIISIAIFIIYLLRLKLVIRTNQAPCRFTINRWL